MEHALAGIGWFAVIILVFAIIGVIATIRWIIGLVTNTERAVETGVRSVGDKLTHHDE
jgi:hypothetical protein